MNQKNLFEELIGDISTLADQEQDSYAEQEQRVFARVGERLRLQREQQDIKHRDQDQSSRNNYSKFIIGFAVAWVTAVICLVVASGLKSITGFDLSDKVLMVLVGSTTVNVLGLLGIVMKYLFQK